MYSRFTRVRISMNLNSSQLNMFREIILPIFRSTRLCVTACGVMHTPRCCRPKTLKTPKNTEQDPDDPNQQMKEISKCNTFLINGTVQI